MLKKSLMVAFATVMLSNLNAQEEAVRFGAKAGLNIASITGDFTDELSSKIGFTLGGVVEIPVRDKFAFQPEVLFSTQGAKYEDSDVGYSDESTVKLSYINIPMMAKFYVAEGLSLQAGPQLGILVSAKDEGEYTEQNVTVEYDTDIKDDLSTVDFGLNIRQFDGELAINTGIAKLDAPIPMAFARVGGYLPFTGLSVMAEANYIGYGETNHMDYQVVARYTIPMIPVLDINVEACYRAFQLNIDPTDFGGDSDDLTADIDMSGIFLGISLHL